MNLPLLLRVSSHRITKPFGSAFVTWFDSATRDLPWRRDQRSLRDLDLGDHAAADACRAVIPYYERFLARFPTVEVSGERAGGRPAEDVGRPRILLPRAQPAESGIADEAAAFPRDYDSIRALPGVGDYTAAAVASIAFGLPHAAVDGNVVRVLSRVTGGIGQHQRRSRRSPRHEEAR